MPRQFLNKLNKVAAAALKKIKEFMENESSLRHHVREVLQEESENFLFIAAGEGLVFKGMHYPDSAFSEQDFPVLFRGEDKNVIIAAWPQNYIRDVLREVSEKNEKNEERVWQQILEEFMGAAVDVYKEGKVSDIL
jgi:hypothetical protein